MFVSFSKERWYCDTRGDSIIPKIVLIIGAIVFFLFTNPGIIYAFILVAAALGLFWLDKHVFNFFSEDD